MTPDRVFANGSFVTDCGRPIRAAAVVGGRIRALGESPADVRGAAAPGAEEVDLGGGAVYPGFADSHVHAVNYGRSRMGVPCWPSDVSSVREIVELLRAAHRRLPPGKWIKGRGYDPARLAEGRAPAASELDLPDGRCAVLDSFDFHRRVANHAALEAAGIGPGTPDPPDGEIVRDERGAPAGELLDGARRLLDPVIPPWSDEEDEQAVELAADYFLSLGFTYVTNAAPLTMSRPGEEVAAFLRLSRRRALRLRFTSMIRAELLDAAGGLGLAPGVGAHNFRIGGAKLFADGAFGPRSACMSAPYSDTGSSGSMADEEELEAAVRKGARLGWQMCIHAIGDAAVEAAARLLAAHPPAGRMRPHRIEHCCLTSPAAVEAMREGGIAPVPQLSFLRLRAPDFLAALGERRLAEMYPLRTWIDAGLKPIHSSDTPVIPDASPTAAAAAAVYRVDAEGRTWGPGEGISFDEAAAMMTRWPAEADGEGAYRGRIAPGFLADFTVLPRDPRPLPPDELAEMPPSMTIVGGEVAWRSDAA